MTEEACVFLLLITIIIIFTQTSFFPERLILLLKYSIFFFQLGFTNTIVQKSTQYCVNEKNEASDDGEHSEQKVRNDIHILV